MNARSKSIKSDLKKIDSHEIKPSEYEELPELTDEMFDKAVYKVAGIKKPVPKRRGPQKAPTKIALQLRLPPEVVDYFKAEGPGWQTKISIALKDWIKHHPHSSAS